MKTLFYLISFSFTSIIVYAQYPIDMKRGNIWFLGNNNQYPTENVMKIDFNSNIPIYTTIPNFPIDFTGISTGICNTNGRLLFYANDDEILDSTHQIIQNGDELNTTYYLGDGSYTQGAIMLDLLNKNKSIYIHQGYNLEYPILPIRKDTLLVTTIDMNANNGSGSVISKNIPFFTDYSHTLSFKVCRHANGRDWWFIQPDTTYNKIHRFLITPNGIDTLAPQIMQNPPLPPNSWSNHTVFSPNGDKWASRILTNHFDTTVVVYDFDRCSGLLSNYKAFHRPSGTWCGLAFSLDSRYLYHSCSQKLMQYDLNSSNIAASEVILAQGQALINCTQSFNSADNVPIPIYTPNNQLFIPIGTRTNKVHTINNPNGAGAACDLRLCNITLPAEYSYQSPPNFPNYRLGSVDGSVCDSLGIDNIVSTENTENEVKRIKVSPNPTNGNTRIEWTETLQKATKVEIINCVGQTIETIKIENNTIYQDIDTKNLQNGIYFVRLSTSENQTYTTKLIKISD